MFSTVAIVLTVGVFREPRATPLMMGFLLVLSIAAVAWTVRRNPWAFADEVVDEGQWLVVRRRSVQVRVAFDDIVDVNRAAATGFTRHVLLTLATAVPPFGTEIVFRPRDFASLTTEELNRLIGGLRARAPRVASPQHASELSGPVAATDGSASRMTFFQRRTILACVALLMALAVGNYLFGLKVFGPFDRLRPPDIAPFLGGNLGLCPPGVRTNTCPVF
jgi:hypothetical protein